jgi:GDPmannose 4,6-dehydratase
MKKGLIQRLVRVIVEIDSKYYRPSEVDTLLGDPSKAKDLLGWNPNETSFDKLVELMVYSDINLVEKENK